MPDKSYLAGGFGIDTEPDFPVAKKRKTSKASKNLPKKQRKGTAKRQKPQDEELSDDSLTDEVEIVFREPLYERIHGNSI